MWTDGQVDMAKLTATFSSVANAPKNVPKDTNSCTGDLRVELEAAISETEVPSLCEFIYRVMLTPSGISDLCGTVAGMVTPNGSMSTEGETLQVSVLPYRCSICPPLVTRQMSIL